MIVDRITIDLDDYERNMQMRALRAYYTLTRMDVVAQVDVYVSSGGQGIHLTGRLSERLTASERHEIRLSLNDDGKRAALDAERGQAGHATDIFWSEKEGNSGERQEMPGIWAALDRIESTRAPDSARVEALAKHGRKGVWDTHGLNRPSMAVQTD